jgi:hypothetical protein
VSAGKKPVRTEQAGPRKLKKKKKKKKRRVPLPEAHYYTLLVGVIGYRQNLYCTLEEFSGRLARGADCRHLISVYKERYLQQCQLEQYVAGLAYNLYPNFTPPIAMLNYPELLARLPTGLDSPVRVDGKEVT